MKKKLVLFILLTAFCSCQAILESESGDKSTDGSSDEEFVTITATLDNPTKTVLDSDLETVLWKPSETIMVFSDGVSAIFTSTNKSNTTTAEFTGTIAVGTEIFGVYPSTGASFADGHINTSLPGAQIAQAGSFSDKLLITAGHSNDLNIRFYNVCSGLRFTLEQEGIRAVTIQSLDDTPMAGSIAIDFDEDGKPYISNISNPKTEITVFAPDYGVFETGKWYYIVTLPGTFSSGIAFYFFDGYSQGSRILGDKSFTFKRSIFKQTQNLDSGVELLECSPAPDEIWYVNRDCDISNIFFDGMTMQSNTYKNGIGVYKATTSFATIRGGLSNRLLSVIFPEGAIEIGNLYNYSDGIQIAVVPSTVNHLAPFAFQHFNNSIIFKGPAPSFDSIQDDEGDPYYSCLGANASLLIKPEYYHSFLLKMPNDYMKNVQLIKPVPNNQIWYITTDNNVYEHSSFAADPSDCFDANLLSNTVNDGWGRMLFDNDIHQVGDHAFYVSTNLEQIFLPNSVQSLGRASFCSCSSLTTIFLPKSLQTIRSASFEGCTSLNRIVIPENATFLEKDGSNWTKEVNAFNLCSSLRQFYYKNEWTNKIVQDNTLISVAPTTTYLSISCYRIGNGAVENCPISHLDMHCKEIGRYAFLNCINLTTLSIPSECTSINANAFYGCFGLNSITVNSTTPPAGGNNMFYNTNNCPIYVPAVSVNTYKTAPYWSEYADRIQAIP